MLPTPVFWLGEFHGLYCPWGPKGSDMSERHENFHHFPPAPFLWLMSLQDTHSDRGVGAWHSLFTAMPLLRFLWRIQLAWWVGGARQEVFAWRCCALTVSRRRPRTRVGVGPGCAPLCAGPGLESHVVFTAFRHTEPSLALGWPETGRALGSASLWQSLSASGCPVFCHNTYFMFWLLVSLCKLSLSLFQWWGCKLFWKWVFRFSWFPNTFTLPSTILGDFCCITTYNRRRRWNWPVDG